MQNKYYEYITGTGVIVPDTSVLLSDIKARFVELFGDNLDLSPTTTQGRLFELFNRSETFTLQACAAVSNMLNLNKANGFVLDDLGALFLIERKPATKTSTTVVLTGVPNTIIPANTRIKTAEGNIFVNPASAVIGSDGSVSVRYQAVETGAIPALPNTLKIILDGVNGLETANNPANAVIGQEQESDGDFRNRIKISLNTNAIAVLSAIKASVEQVPGVVGSYCYDNYDSSAVIIDGLSVPAHSLLVVVDGGDDQEIANAIYAKKTAGTGYVAEENDAGYTVVEKDVIDEAYGTTYKVRFVRPTLTDVDIVVNVARKSYSGDNLEQAVKNAIMTFANGDNPEVDGIVIGGSLSPFEVGAAISSELPDVFITSVSVGVHGQSVSPATMTFGSIHKANILEQNITVNITEN